MAYTIHLNTTIFTLMYKLCDWFCSFCVGKHPDAVIVCGGDLNQLDMLDCKALSGWSFLVEFPKRGNACLDNCLTIRPDLFGKAYPFQMLMKMDRETFVLPTGTKLKSMHCKVHFCDTRDHCKHTLYLASFNLACTSWR